MNIILTLLSKKTIAPSIEMLRLQPYKKINFKAGQCLNLLIPSDNSLVERSFSIASEPNQEIIELIVRIVNGGLASTFLQNLQPGDVLKAKGPKGSFVIPQSNSAAKLIFFSSGTGIAPIRSMIRDILINRKQPSIFLCITQGHEGEFLLKNEFDDLARDYGDFHFEYSVDPLKTAVQITQQNKDGYEFYICGGPIFVSEINKTLIAGGIREHQIHLEKYWTTHLIL